ETGADAITRGVELSPPNGGSPTGSNRPLTALPLAQPRGLALGACIPQLNAWPCPLQEGPQVIAEGLTRRELPTFDQLRDRLTFEAESSPMG
ncbi:MAG: hypothetical protein HW404_1325, partial [Anaerolineales bacterium]|nr:hypothetical protein [Anaerolineales bacterium]